MNVLEVNNLTSGYGKMVIVDKITFNVSENSIVTVVGPNGSGKSTLLKTIMGFAKIFCGSVNYYGKDITRETADNLFRKGIVFVPQLNNVFINMTVEENIKLGIFINKKSISG